MENHLKEKILVTGCAGFIGMHLCNRLLKLGYKLENHESKIDFTYSEEEVRTFDLINSKLKIKANNNQSSFEKNLIQKQKNILKFN